MELGRRTLTEFGMTDFPTGMADPTADGQRDQGEHQCRKGERCLHAETEERKNERRCRHERRCVEHIHTAVGPMQVNLEPLLRVRIRHRIDPVVGVLAVLRYGPHGQTGENEEDQRSDLRRATPQNQTDDQRQNPTQGAVNGNRIEEHVDILGLPELTEELVEFGLVMAKLG